MSINPGSEGKRTALAAAGFLLVPVLCCGLPLLIAAGALGAVGSILGNPWVIAAVVVVILAAVAWFARRRTSATRDRATQDDWCCPPPTRSQSDRTHESSNPNQEP
jgi:membrane protein implicated in regulation of membrane protease activity